jgi:hypothetical protein
VYECVCLLALSVGLKTPYNLRLNGRTMAEGLCMSVCVCVCVLALSVRGGEDRRGKYYKL